MMIIVSKEKDKLHRSIFNKLELLKAADDTNETYVSCFQMQIDTR